MSTSWSHVRKCASARAPLVNSRRGRFPRERARATADTDASWSRVGSRPTAFGSVADDRAEEEGARRAGCGSGVGTARSTGPSCAMRFGPSATSPSSTCSIRRSICSRRTFHRMPLSFSRCAASALQRPRQHPADGRASADLGEVREAALARRDAEARLARAAGDVRRAAFALETHVDRRNLRDVGEGDPVPREGAREDALVRRHAQEERAGAAVGVEEELRRVGKARRPADVHLQLQSPAEVSVAAPDARVEIGELSGREVHAVVALVREEEDVAHPARRPREEIGVEGAEASRRHEVVEAEADAAVDEARDDRVRVLVVVDRDLDLADEVKAKGDLVATAACADGRGGVLVAGQGGVLFRVARDGVGAWAKRGGAVKTAPRRPPLRRPEAARRGASSSSAAARTSSGRSSTKGRRPLPRVLERRLRSRRTEGPRARRREARRERRAGRAARRLRAVRAPRGRRARARAPEAARQGCVV